jgi:hypothetical protein
MLAKKLNELGIGELGIRNQELRLGQDFNFFY